MTRFLPRLLLLAILTTFALMIMPVGQLQAAQQNAVRLDVQAGYDGDGQYHVGFWFPVNLVVANDGSDLHGTIEWYFPGETSASFSYEIDLPGGARKQVHLPVVSNESPRSAEVRLQVDGQQVLKHRLALNPIDTSEIAIGVLSTNQTLLNSLTTVELVSGYKTVLSRMRADMLPDTPTLIEGLDVIVIHDQDTAKLTDSQCAALKQWVRMGGTLLVSGGVDAQLTTRNLADILPVEIGEGMRENMQVGALERVAGSADLSSLISGISANQITLRSDTQAIDTSNLIVTRDFGTGKVIFAAFDLDILRTWQSEPRLWRSVITIEERMQMGYSFRWRNENLIRDTLQLAALSLPAPVLLLLLIVIYIIIIGPVNFLILRRIRRIDMAWVTTPGLVALFLLVTYGSSFIIRGTQPQISQLAIVQSFEGASEGKATSFVSIFSPHRRTYTMSFSPNTLISPGSFESFQFSMLPVNLSDSAATVPDLLIDVSALRTLLIEQQVSDVPVVQSQLMRDTSRISGSVRNNGNETLYNALIVSGDAAQSLGNIDPGTSMQVNLARNLQTFPSQIDMPTDGLFNQQQVLQNLFSFDRFTFGGPAFQGQQGLPESDAVYLLAWRSRPTTSVRVNGDDSPQKGMTLYLVRLNS
ncbi:MAG: hypothetical protein HGA19_15380 [Oscillochloris sp.]|nr:hypothetical protein [Oscillochloris sp.]